MTHSDRSWFSDRRIITPWVLALAGLVAYVIARYGVDVPIADEWTLIWLFREIANGDLSIPFLFEQHNEHRILVPRLVLAATAFLSGYNMKANMFLSLLLAALIYYMLARLARNQLPGESRYLAPAHGILAALLFSLIHNEAWLYGINVMWLMVNLPLVVGVWVLYRRGQQGIAMRLLLAGLCILFATLTAAHGALIWLALLPLVVSLPGSSAQRRWRALLWIALFALTLFLYLRNLHTPDGHPDPLAALRAPHMALIGYLALLGAPLARANVALAAVAGLVVGLGYLYFVLRAWRRGSWQGELPWICIGLYALLFAGANTVGRVGFGLEYALTGRYMLTTVMLWASVIYMARLALVQAGPNGNAAAREARGPAYLLAGGLMFFLLADSLHAMSAVRYTYDRNVYKRECYRLVHYAPRDCLMLLYPEVRVVRNRAAMLEDLGFRRFARELEYVSEPEVAHGVVDWPVPDRPVLVNRNVATVSVHGWAALPGPWRAANIILFSTAGETPDFFASTSVTNMSEDLVQTLGSGRLARSRWQIDLPLDTLPDGESVVYAWTYDAQHARLVRLMGGVRLAVAPKTAP